MWFEGLYSGSYLRPFHTSSQLDCATAHSLWDASAFWRGIDDVCFFLLTRIVAALQTKNSRYFKISPVTRHIVTGHQSMQDVDEFVHQIYIRNVSFHHLLSNGCSAVNGCRQNDRSNCWLKTSQVIHITPVHQLTPWEDKNPSSRIKIQPHLFRRKRFI